MLASCRPSLPPVIARSLMARQSVGVANAKAQTLVRRSAQEASKKSSFGDRSHSFSKASPATTEIRTPYTLDPDYRKSTEQLVALNSSSYAPAGALRRALVFPLRGAFARAFRAAHNSAAGWGSDTHDRGISMDLCSCLHSGHVALRWASPRASACLRRAHASPRVSIEWEVAGGICRGGGVARPMRGGSGRASYAVPMGSGTCAPQACRRDYRDVRHRCLRAPGWTVDSSPRFPGRPG